MSEKFEKFEKYEGWSCISKVAGASNMPYQFFPVFSTKVSILKDHERLNVPQGAEWCILKQSVIKLEIYYFIAFKWMWILPSTLWATACINVGTYIDI